MTELHVRHVLDVYPPHAKLSFPLVLQPHAGARIVVDRAHHARHSAEVSAAVYREQQVHRASLPLPLAEGRVEPLVAVLGAAPDLVLDAAVDIVLRVRLDHEEPSERCAQVEILRVILVLNVQLVE